LHQLIHRICGLPVKPFCKLPVPQSHWARDHQGLCGQDCCLMLSARSGASMAEAEATWRTGGTKVAAHTAEVIILSGSSPTSPAARTIGSGAPRNSAARRFARRPADDHLSPMSNPYSHVLAHDEGTPWLHVDRDRTLANDRTGSSHYPYLMRHSDHAAQPDGREPPERRQALTEGATKIAQSSPGARDNRLRMFRRPARQDKNRETTKCPTMPL
jgi:hypothetical protein